MPNNNQLATKKLNQFRNELMAQWMPKVQAACPRGTEPQTIVRTLMQALHDNPYIIEKCTLQSIGQALVQAATYGLEISSGPIGGCYIVPYKDQAKLQVSYKGIKQLVRRSGEGLLYMDAVHEGDQFQDNGNDEKPFHVKSDDPDRFKKPVTHAYAYVKLNSGWIVSKVMSRRHLLAHRDAYSQNWKRNPNADNPWHEDNPSFGKMCAKTCCRAIANDGDAPMSTTLRQAFMTIENDDVIDGTAVPSAELPPTTTAALPPANDETPPDLDKTWFDAELQKKMSGGDLLSFRNDCLEQFPNDRQYIFDACEEHDMTLRHAANQEQ